ncbi:MAG: hypothetical protein AAFN74_15605 [Myxococcota bacterium]
MSRWLKMISALIVGACMSAPTGAQAENERVLGITMPTDARRIEDDYFRASNTYDRTIRHFSRLYGRSSGIIWRPIRGNPRVKGMHIINNRRRRQWDAINIYESRRKVFIYVVPSAVASEKKR